MSGLHEKIDRDRAFRVGCNEAVSRRVLSFTVCRERVIGDSSGHTLLEKGYLLLRKTFKVKRSLQASRVQTIVVDRHAAVHHLFAKVAAQKASALLERRCVKSEGPEERKKFTDRIGFQ